jgi:chromate reductase
MGTPEYRPLTVLGIAGSLRRDSFNRGLIEAACDSAPDAVTVIPFDLAPIPLYNADLEEGGDPGPVSALKEAIRGADALLIATPEYNQGTPGVLKNALDWASRQAEEPVLRGKPVAIMGASPGMTGTARSQVQLRQTLAATGALVMVAPQVHVAGSRGKFDEDGRLSDDPTREYIERLLGELKEWVLRLR